MRSEPLSAADLAAMTGFRGVPGEFVGPLVLVLLQREFVRLGAALGAVGSKQALSTNGPGFLRDVAFVPVERCSRRDGFANPPYLPGISWD